MKGWICGTNGWQGKNRFVDVMPKTGKIAAFRFDIFTTEARSSLRYTEFIFSTLLIVLCVCMVIFIEKQMRLLIPFTILKVHWTLLLKLFNKFFNLFHHIWDSRFNFRSKFHPHVLKILY